MSKPWQPYSGCNEVRRIQSPGDLTRDDILAALRNLQTLSEAT